MGGIKPSSLYEIAGVWVAEELYRLILIYVLVMAASMFTSIPGWLLIVMGVAVTAGRLYLAGGWYYNDYRIDGQTVLVTGANTGIGIEIARDLYKRGARVIMACRNKEKAEKARYDIIHSTNSSNQEVVVKLLDLGSLDSVRKFAADVIATEKRLDILINNAGIMWVSRKTTVDGFERTFQVNHLAPFLLTHLLTDKLKQAPQGRIINVSSMANSFANAISFDNLNGEKMWNQQQQYCITKLMNILHTNELARRLKDTRITANSNHPGCVHTELISHVANAWGALRALKWTYLWLTHKTPAQGAQSAIMLAVDPEYSRTSGKYIADCMEVKPNRLAESIALAERLWSVSEQLCGLVGDAKISS